LQYGQTPPLPQQETVVELALTAPSEPAAELPPDPPAPSLPTEEPAFSLPPEPLDAATTPPAMPFDQQPAADEPALVTTPQPETAAVVAPSLPVIEATPPPKLVRALPRPSPHPATTAPRIIAARQDSAASAAPPKTEANAAAVPSPSSSPRSANFEAALEARIRDAVQAAVHYPAAARMMGVTGRARVLLDYRSGSVSSPMLAQSSGASMLDEAALAAARAAHYPPAPAEIQGQLLRLLVWVEFKPG